ncbi:MAG: hypothetical protein ACWGPR_08470 [Candidatus Deferrimicrobiaceae bacterium]
MSPRPPLPLNPGADVDHERIARDVAVVDNRVSNIERLVMWTAGAVLAVLIAVGGAVVSGAIQFGEMRAQIQSIEKRLDRQHAHDGATARRE